MDRFVFFILLLAAGAARAEPDAPLRVAVYDVPPYGYTAPGGAVDGVSADLWPRVAERLGRRFTPAYMAFALPKGSPLERPNDGALI